MREGLLLAAGKKNSMHLSPLLGGLLGLIGGGLLPRPQALHLLPLTLDHLGKFEDPTEPSTD